MKLLTVTFALTSLTLWLIEPFQHNHSPLAGPQPVGRLRAAATDKIPLDASRWYQLNNVTNGLGGLFDGNTAEPVNTGWNKLVKNYDAYYPLTNGERMTIERIRMYDGQGSNTDDPLTLSIITDKWERVPIARFIGDQYNAWVGPDPNQPTNFDLKTPVSNARYLVINTSGSYPTELELYGSYQGGQTPSANPARQTRFRQAAGVNVFEWNFLSAQNSTQLDESLVNAMKGFSGIRHYLDWERIEAEKGEYSFNPTLSGTWNYDAMYERMKAEGIEVLTCLKTLPEWLVNTYPANQRDNENVPAPYGSDLTAPRTYIDQARAGFQFVARYGSNKGLDPSLVKVSGKSTWAGKNTVKIGLGLVRYIECENERDKTWKGRKAYQTAREYAANLSAFYDGHKNALGPGVGVKNADPAIQVVLGGLSTTTTDYVRGMIDWCKEFRGYKANGQVDLCWDVINVHIYANDAGTSQNGGNSRGAAPEVAGIAEQAGAFITLAHQQANDLPVWITEAGYDVNQGSPLKAIAIGRKSVLETQADWTLRTALLYNRIGIDRLFLYQLYDDNPSNPTQFSSMGLVNTNKTRKPAADYLWQAKALIGDYQYKETISRDPLVDRYELNGRSAYVLMIPDEKARTGTYQLPIAKGDSVVVCTPAIGRDEMSKSLQGSQTGTLTVNVSETPVFVIPLRASDAPSENDLGSLLVYPNPTADYVDVTVENAGSDSVMLALYENSGRLIQVANAPKTGRIFQERMDLSTLPTGQYLIEVRQGRSRAVRKLIRAR